MWLAEHLLGANLETRGAALSPVQKMKVFLRYCANPGFQSGIAEEMGCTQPTVSRIFHEVLERIVLHAGEWIRFPNTENLIVQAKKKWSTRFHFPTAIGAVDCTHIRVDKPGQFEDEYVNRKSFSSINVQITCYQNCIITSVEQAHSKVWMPNQINQSSKIIIAYEILHNIAKQLRDQDFQEEEEEEQEYQQDLLPIED